jgi:hypothetical protein
MSDQHPWGWEASLGCAVLDCQFKPRLVPIIGLGVQTQHQWAAPRLRRSRQRERKHLREGTAAQQSRSMAELGASGAHLFP